jgi:AraC family transcriptional regulator of adaptative response/methylated-DNA-[protein]-cysteine methyltransferase
LNKLSQNQIDYARIEKAIHFLEKNFQKHPDLQEIADIVGLSEFHFQRMFRQWVGISPKQFVQFLTKEYAKDLLAQSRNILDVTYTSGLTSPGRLHDLFVRWEAVTPGEFSRQGSGISIFYGFHPTPFGECLLATTQRGICGLYFTRDGDRERSINILHKEWPDAEFHENLQNTQTIIQNVFDAPKWAPERPFHLYLKGTNFQLKVWEALLKIPQGSVVSYQDIARKIGNPKGVRAVGSAVAHNPISYLIPCHRVIRKEGIFGNYQGGTERKKLLLAWEMAQTGKTGKNDDT